MFKEKVIRCGYFSVIEGILDFECLHGCRWDVSAKSSESKCLLLNGLFEAYPKWLRREQNKGQKAMKWRIVKRNCCWVSGFTGDSLQWLFWHGEGKSDPKDSCQQERWVYILVDFLLVMSTLIWKYAAVLWALLTSTTSNGISII